MVQNSVCLLMVVVNNICGCSSGNASNSGSCVRGKVVVVAVA